MWSHSGVLVNFCPMRQFQKKLALSKACSVRNETLRTLHSLITACMANSDFEIKMIICWDSQKQPYINTEICVLHIPFKLFACIDCDRRSEVERANKWIFKITKMWTADFICYNDILIGIFALTFFCPFLPILQFGIFQNLKSFSNYNHFRDLWVFSVNSIFQLNTAFQISSWTFGEEKQHSVLYFSGLFTTVCELNWQRQINRKKETWIFVNILNCMRTQPSQNVMKNTEKQLNSAAYMPL